MAANARVLIEFLIPMFTEALSTQVPTQLSQEILFACRISSILLKMVSDVPASSPTFHIQCISSYRVIPCEFNKKNPDPFQFS